jgi:L-lactate dehydrogenase complex protein LldG
MPAREQILGRIRSSLDARGQDARSDTVCDNYRVSTELDIYELTNLFCERVAEYTTTVKTTSGSDLLKVLTDACRSREASRLLVPADLPTAWQPHGVELCPDQGLSFAELAACDGVITGCAVAIAETGTIVLDHGRAQGRRALSLLCDYHLCVVSAEQIVGCVPEAIRGLARSITDDHRPITFISGPSATSDIELRRVEGVHGPRTLEVVVVGDQPAS